VRHDAYRTYAILRRVYRMLGHLREGVLLERRRRAVRAYEPKLPAGALQRAAEAACAAKATAPATIPGSRQPVSTASLNPHNGLAVSRHGEAGAIKRPG
jgi:hypothetical protein